MKPIAWIDKNTGKPKMEGFIQTDYDIPLYTHPAKPIKDREADRKRFSDEGFNRWLDESISDSGHTVYDLVENVCDAWHGWENSQYYRPAKTLTDEEIWDFINALCLDMGDYWELTEKNAIPMIRAILRKAQEK